MGATAKSPLRGRVGLAAVVILLVGFAITAYAVNELNHSIARAREQRLVEAADQSTTLFTAVAQTIQTLLTTGGAVASATHGNADAFRRSVGGALSDTPIITNAVLLDLAGRRVRVVATAGRKPDHLGTCDASCTAALRQIARTGEMNVVASGTKNGVRKLGLADVPRPGSRYAVYSEIFIPTELYSSSNVPDSIVYAFYFDDENPLSLVASNTADLPIRGLRLVRPIQLAGQHPTIVFGSSEERGAFTVIMPWLLLGTGITVSLALALLVEGMRRRRNTALILVDELLAKNAELDASDAALRSAEQRYRSLVEELPLVTYIDEVNEQASTIYISPQIEGLLGWSAEAWLEDEGFFVKRLHPDDRDRVLEENRAHNELGKEFRSEYRLVTREGEARWVLDVAVIEEAADGAAVQSRGFILDITDRKEAELARLAAEVELREQAELNRHQALHDPLTDLPNRTLFRDRIEQEIRRGTREGKGAAVMVIDLDRFKEVNDTLGHGSGDALLLGLSKRLRSSIRASDTVARLGGDEFGVLAPGVGGPAEALSLADAIHKALEAPVGVAGLELEVTASVGIALFPQHGADVETLIRHADVALYRSKESHSSVVYSPDHDHYSPTRLRLLTGLRRAIANGEIVVNYQPQTSASSAVIRGVEALVRWEHPELGLIMPDQFIPLAEHTDLIRPLTFHVLDTAVSQCGAWTDRGWDIGVAVNVTGRDILDAGFPSDVLDCLRRHGVEPGRLELEITENTIFSDPVRAHSVLRQLSDLGVRIAIDDFGAGNSSLGYLARLPVDVLKIDKSFVLAMSDGSTATAIVRSTIELGHNLGLEVIAEGVETEELRQQLIDLRCDTVQGFVFGRAMPATEVETMFGGTQFPGRGRAPFVVARRLKAAS